MTGRVHRTTLVSAMTPRARCGICWREKPKKNVGYGCSECVGQLHMDPLLERLADRIVGRVGGAEAGAWCFDRSGQGFALRHRSRIGRTVPNAQPPDLAINHGEVSRTHARVLREDDGWAISAECPPGMLQVDGTPVGRSRPVRLRDRSRIRLGAVVELLFRDAPTLPNYEPFFMHKVETLPTRGSFVIERDEEVIRVEAAGSATEERVRFILSRGERILRLSASLWPLFRRLLIARAEGRIGDVDRAALAEDTSMSQTHIRQCKRDLRLKVAEAFEVSADYLIENEGLRLDGSWRVRFD